MQRIARLFAMLRYLRIHTPPVTAQALAHHFDISLRSVYRDIDSLRALGASIGGEAGFGYCLIEDAQKRQTQRDVHPLALVYMDDAQCLLAWCLLRKDFRSVRLDRISDLNVSSVSFRPHRAHLLRECLAHMKRQRPAATVVD